MKLKAALLTLFLIPLSAFAPLHASAAITDGGAHLTDTATIYSWPPVIRPANIVTVTRFPAGGGAPQVQMVHNSRVAAGASWVVNQIANPAGVATPVAQFIALSSSNATPLFSDTTCPSEITTSGLGRTTGTYGAPSSTPTTLDGVITYTMSATWNATGTYTINRLCTLTALAGGTLLFETVLSQAVTGGNGDTINVVWTVHA